MKCPRCGHRRSKVTGTKPLPGLIWRTRTCLACGYRWNTSEIEDEPIEYDLDLRKRKQVKNR